MNSIEVDGWWEYHPISPPQTGTVGETQYEMGTERRTMCRRAVAWLTVVKVNIVACVAAVVLLALAGEGLAACGFTVAALAWTSSRFHEKRAERAEANL